MLKTAFCVVMAMGCGGEVGGANQDGASSPQDAINGSLKAIKTRDCKRIVSFIDPEQRDFMLLGNLGAMCFKTVPAMRFVCVQER